MESAGMGSDLNFNWKLLLKALIFVILLGGVYYLISIYLSSYFAWSVVFLILLNVYLIYRVSIRNSVSKKVFGDDDYYDTESRPSQKVPQNSDPSVEQQQSAYEEVQDQYEKCPECGEDLIPGLGYCEACGYQFDD